MSTVVARSRAILPLVLSLAAAPSLALPPDLPAYGALRGARPEGPGAAVKDLVLTRDVFTLTFEAGTFTFLPDVAGRTVGAVFQGKGRWDLLPATETEKRHLAFLTGEKDLAVLTDRFERAVLLFSDGTADEIRQKAVGASVPDGPPASAAYERFLKQARKDFKTNFHLRILQDLLDGREGVAGTFLAFPDGKKLSPALLAVDPRGVETLGIGSLLAGEESALYLADPYKGGLWYLSHTKDEVGRGLVHRSRSEARAVHYRIDTEIQRNTELKGSTTIRVASLAPGLRVLRFSLLPKLRIREAAFSAGSGSEADWTPLPFIQEAEDEDADPAIVLPTPVAPGHELLVRVGYQGKGVLNKTDEGSYAVGARESWYPNVGAFSETSTFDLTYRVPKKSQIVSVGKRVENREEGDTSVSVWTADQPIRVAGFNYGVFKTLSKDDPESKLSIDVYTNPETPYADQALADGINSARVYSRYFGAIASSRVAITQAAQWTFGQSWPSLVFLPSSTFSEVDYRAAFSDVSLRMAGFDAKGLRDFVDQVGPHEFAHQWWGHQVGWASYHDQWLSEGFAEFSVALVLQHTKGADAYDQFWKSARKLILEKPRGGTTSHAEAGPISLGWRLATERDPLAYSALVYTKGAYVLHMLRMLMRDPRSRTPDESFIAMMQDFAGRNAGRNASTADFQAAVERHMHPLMDAAGNGKMTWFFDQWVHGTELPSYVSKLDLEESGGGKVRVKGSVSQAGVSAGFRALVGLYLDFGKGEVVRFGVLPMIGNKTMSVDVELTPAKKPKRALVNALNDVLAKD